MTCLDKRRLVLHWDALDALLLILCIASTLPVCRATCFYFCSLRDAFKIQVACFVLVLKGDKTAYKSVFRLQGACLPRAQDAATTNIDSDTLTRINVMIVEDIHLYPLTSIRISYVSRVFWRDDPTR